MNRRAILAALVGAAAITAAPAAAQDLSGTWTLSSQGRRGGPQTSTLVLVQDGESLTGTLTLTLGRRGGGGGPMELEISDGTVDGSSFSFTITLTFGDNSFDRNYSGTVDGDEISGTIQGGRGGGQPFTGTRGG